MFKFKIFLLFITLNLSAQNFKLKVVADASKGKNDNSKIYGKWKATGSPFYIDIKSKSIETYERRDFINVVKILNQQKPTKNRNGDDLLRYNCKENGGNFKMWFIKYLKPLKNGVIGEIIMNFDTSEYLYIYKVKYHK